MNTAHVKLIVGETKTITLSNFNPNIDLKPEWFPLGAPITIDTSPSGKAAIITAGKEGRYPIAVVIGSLHTLIIILDCVTIDLQVNI